MTHRWFTGSEVDMPDLNTVWGKTAARALALAATAHANQTDKAGAPYLEHCRRVAAKLDDDESRTVALLHDILEDTTVTEAELREMFDAAIVDAVVAITRIEGESPQAYYARVRENPLARRVKLADIHDNLEPARITRLDAQTQRRLLSKYGAALVALAG